MLLPILITDCSLPFQHDRHHPDPNQREEHPHLPTFEFVGGQVKSAVVVGFQPALWRSHKHNIPEHSHTIGSAPISGPGVRKDESSPNSCVTAFALHATSQEYLPPQRSQFWRWRLKLCRCISLSILDRYSEGKETGPSSPK